MAGRRDDVVCTKQRVFTIAKWKKKAAVRKNNQTMDDIAVASICSKG